ncbi:MAG: peptide transporter [Myxococcaceae bacterium]|nr:peptide transporter [Myxococcaceae bacterium]
MPLVTERREALSVAATVALGLAGLWARCAGFAQVLTPEGVLLKPTDSHYYVRFAQLQIEAFPRFVSFDPWVNFPEGARIIWPPVHTGWVALHELFTRANPEVGAAWAGVTASAIWLCLSAVALWRTFGARVTVLAMAVLALLPAMIESSALGNADHHVHEPYLALFVSLCIVRMAKRPGRGGAAVALGTVLAVSRLLTTGTILLLPCAALGLVACALLKREASGRLARDALIAGGVASTLSAVFALMWGEPFSLEPVALSGFLPAASVAVFGLVAAVLALRARAVPFAAAAALPALLALALVGRSLLSARAQLAGDDPLLKVVIESQPLWRVDWAYPSLLGSIGVIFPIAWLGLAMRAVQKRAAEALVFAATTLVLTAAFVAQLRFVQPLGGPLAVTFAIGSLYLMDSIAPVPRRIAWALITLALLALMPALRPREPFDPPTDEALVRSTMSWIRHHTPSPPDYAVVASHDVGHLLTLWAQRPNVASPFSQAPAHLRGNARAAAVLGATDDEAAYRAALDTGARYVLSVPFSVILGRDKSRDDETIARRLLDHAAMGEDGRPATAHFRLLHDSAEERLRVEKGPFARVFEVVPGAVIAGSAPPGAAVEATLKLRTNLGQGLTYRRATVAGPDGRFELRVAYPTRDSASEVRAEGPYALLMGGVPRTVDVPEEAVRAGARVDLSP